MNRDVGTLAAEAGQLLDAVAQRLSAIRTDAEPVEQPTCPTCGHDPSASCTACPVCRFLAVLRGERPEVTARWVDGALTIVQALKALLPETATGADDSGPDDGSGDRPAPGGKPPSRPPGLEHIDIT